MPVGIHILLASLFHLGYERRKNHHDEQAACVTIKDIDEPMSPAILRLN